MLGSIVTLLDRHVRNEIEDALATSRAVAIMGPRQSGKTTLARQLVADGLLARYVTLDDERLLEDARGDAIGFVASLPHGTVIDEVQRAPNLLLEIKRVIDLGGQRPGQFLLTGSADLRRLRSIPDALPGRIEYVELHPLTQGELRGVPDRFIDNLFDGGVDDQAPGGLDRAGAAALVAAGGYPGSQRRSPRRRDSFFASYLDGLVAGEALPDIDALRQPARVIELLRMLAPRSGQVLNISDASAALASSERSIRTWLDLLVAMYLVDVIPAWHRNLDQRRTKRPKLMYCDTGLLCHLLGVDAERLAADPVLLGHVLETFVAAELRRQGGWASRPYRLHHMRDRDGREVDLVVERADGTVVGVEVKATATPRSSDLAGLRHLRDKAGAQWRGGALVTLSDRTRRWDDDLATVPLASLWSAAPSA